jgi:hypothetical protein
MVVTVRRLPVRTVLPLLREITVVVVVVARKQSQNTAA